MPVTEKEPEPGQYPTTFLRLRKRRPRGTNSVRRTAERGRSRVDVEDDGALKPAIRIPASRPEEEVRGSLPPRPRSPERRRLVVSNELRAGSAAARRSTGPGRRRSMKTSTRATGKLIHRASAAPGSTRSADARGVGEDHRPPRSEPAMTAAAGDPENAAARAPPRRRRSSGSPSRSSEDEPRRARATSSGRRSSRRPARRAARRRVAGGAASSAQIEPATVLLHDAPRRARSACPGAGGP